MARARQDGGCGYMLAREGSSQRAMSLYIFLNTRDANALTKCAVSGGIPLQGFLCAMLALASCRAVTGLVGAGRVSVSIEGAVLGIE